jgi:cytochrome P450
MPKFGIPRGGSIQMPNVSSGWIGILTFGVEKRTCVGKNIAMLEIHKLVLALVMRYEIRLAEPEKEWRIRNSWIVRQGGVNGVL